MSGQDIWVIGELRSGAPSAWTLQLVSGARALADETGGRVAVLIQDGAPIDELASHGADRATTVAGTSERCAVEPLVSAARAVFEEEQPRLVLAPDSIFGRDIASQVSAALGMPLLSACERLSIEAGAVKATSSCFGGQLSAARELPQGSCVATVREHTFRARSRSEHGSLEVRSISPQAETRIKVTESRPPDSESLDLGEAGVLVSGGLGVGGPEGFELLDRLASMLGGTTAASRAAVDQGWAPRTKQVGQTGRTVAPQLYFACGISGALQHMVGIRDTDRLVALNIDEQAPIMREADLAAVGDVAQVLPHLLAKLRENGGAS